MSRQDETKAADKKITYVEMPIPLSELKRAVQRFFTIALLAPGLKDKTKANLESIRGHMLILTDISRAPASMAGICFNSTDKLLKAIPELQKFSSLYILNKGFNKGKTNKKHMQLAQACVDAFLSLRDEADISKVTEAINSFTNALPKKFQPEASTINRKIMGHLLKAFTYHHFIKRIQDDLTQVASGHDERITEIKRIIAGLTESLEATSLESREVIAANADSLDIETTRATQQRLHAIIEHHNLAYANALAKFTTLKNDHAYYKQTHVHNVAKKLTIELHEAVNASLAYESASFKSAKASAQETIALAEEQHDKAVEATLRSVANKIFSLHDEVCGNINRLKGRIEFIHNPSRRILKNPAKLKEQFSQWQSNINELQKMLAPSIISEQLAELTQATAKLKELHAEFSKLMSIDASHRPRGFKAQLDAARFVDMCDSIEATVSTALSEVAQLSARLEADLNPEVLAGAKIAYHANQALLVTTEEHTAQAITIHDNVNKQLTAFDAMLNKATESRLDLGDMLNQYVPLETDDAIAAWETKLSSAKDQLNHDLIQVGELINATKETIAAQQAIIDRLHTLLNAEPAPHPYAANAIKKAVRQLEQELEAQQYQLEVHKRKFSGEFEEAQEANDNTTLQLKSITTNQAKLFELHAYNLTEQEELFEMTAEQLNVLSAQFQVTEASLYDEELSGAKAYNAWKERFAEDIELCKNQTAQLSTIVDSKLTPYLASLKQVCTDVEAQRDAANNPQLRAQYASILNKLKQRLKAATALEATLLDKLAKIPPCLEHYNDSLARLEKAAKTDVVFATSTKRKLKSEAGTPALESGIIVNEPYSAERLMPKTVSRAEPSVTVKQPTRRKPRRSQPVTLKAHLAQRRRNMGVRDNSSDDSSSDDSSSDDDEADCHTDEPKLPPATQGRRPAPTVVVHQHRTASQLAALVAQRSAMQKRSDSDTDTDTSNDSDSDLYNKPVVAKSAAEAATVTEGAGHNTATLDDLDGIHVVEVTNTETAGAGAGKGAGASANETKAAQAEAQPKSALFAKKEAPTKPDKKGGQVAELAALFGGTKR